MIRMMMMNYNHHQDQLHHQQQGQHQHPNLMKH
jgi:hypothetical protein